MYGAKKWVVFPPRHIIMSNKHIGDFLDEELPMLAGKGIRPLTCIQTAGAYIPRNC